MKIRTCYANKPKKRKSCATKYTGKTLLNWLTNVYTQVGNPL